MSRPATHWKEIIGDAEAERLERLALVLADIQREYAKKHPLGRALHYKRHAIMRAQFEPTGDGPEWSRVGIFGSPGSFRAYVRFSNGSGKLQKDPTPDVRGIAVKLVGVPGTKLIQGMEHAVTQDFLAILSEAGPFRTPEEFVGTIRAARGSPWLALPRLVGTFGTRMFRVLKTLQAGIAERVESLAKATFYSALPIRWGDHAVKFSFVPRAAAAPGAAIDGAAADHFGRDLAARVKAGAIQFDFRIQAFVDEAHTPIEDPTRPWLAEVSPWLTVAKLVIPQQDLDSEEGKRLSTAVEKLSFDPWHAPVEFRPLGALMRARGVAYRESARTRQAAAEPTGDEPWA